MADSPTQGEQQQIQPVGDPETKLTTEQPVEPAPAEATGGDRDDLSGHPELAPTDPNDPGGVPGAPDSPEVAREPNPDEPGGENDRGNILGRAEDDESRHPEIAVRPLPGSTAPGNTNNPYPVRSDEDALEGHFVKIVAGEHEGQVAAFMHTLDRDAENYPKRILVRFRDATYDHETAPVDYADVRPATPYRGGR